MHSVALSPTVALGAHSAEVPRTDRGHHDGQRLARKPWWAKGGLKNPCVAAWVRVAIRRWSLSAATTLSLSFGGKGDQVCIRIGSLQTPIPTYAMWRRRTRGEERGLFQAKSCANVDLSSTAGPRSRSVREHNKCPFFVLPNRDCADGALNHVQH